MVKRLPGVFVMAKFESYVCEILKNGSNASLHVEAGMSHPQLSKRVGSGQDSHAIAIFVHSVPLVTLSPGPLNLWISPALRGLVLKPLRDHYCQLMGRKTVAATATGNLNPAKCESCLKNARCAYGRVFEPDWSVIDPDCICRGSRDGLRAITLAAELTHTSFLDLVGQWDRESRTEFSGCLPLPQIWVERGTELTARLLSIGKAADELIPTVIEAMDAYGRMSGLWGEPAVHFMVDAARARESTAEASSASSSFGTLGQEASPCGTKSWTLDPRTLPIDPQPGEMPRISLVFQSPLSLKKPPQSATSSSRTGKRTFSRSHSAPPSFAEILSASVRTVRRVVHEFGDSSLWDAHRFEAFFEAAPEVRTVRSDLIFFDQQRSSRRRTDPHTQTGWVGSLTFENIPLYYIPWLHWAGLIGTSDSRNCGAGLWQIAIDT